MQKVSLGQDSSRNALFFLWYSLPLWMLSFPKTSGLDLPSPCPYCPFLLNHTIHSWLPPQSWLQGHQGHSLSPASPFQRALADLTPLKPSLLYILPYQLPPLSANSLSLPWTRAWSWPRRRRGWGGFLLCLWFLGWMMLTQVSHRSLAYWNTASTLCSKL